MFKVYQFWQLNRVYVYIPTLNKNKPVLTQMHLGLLTA